MPESSTDEILENAAEQTAAPSAAANFKTKAIEATETVTSEIRSFATQAAETARDAAAKGKEKAVEKAAGVSRMLEEGASNIERELGEKYGQYMRTAATKVDELVKSVEGKDVEHLIEDARNFVRKSPGIAIGAAAAAGFLLARLFKSGHDED